MGWKFEKYPKNNISKRKKIKKPENRISRIASVSYLLDRDGQKGGPFTYTHFNQICNTREFELQSDIYRFSRIKCEHERSWAASHRLWSAMSLRFNANRNQTDNWPCTWIRPLKFTSSVVLVFVSSFKLPHFQICYQLDFSDDWEIMCWNSWLGRFVKQGTQKWRIALMVHITIICMIRIG